MKTLYSKGNWLTLLRSAGFSEYVAESIVFSYSEWTQHRASLLQRLALQFEAVPIIVRSSRTYPFTDVSEDSGRYLTLGPISSSDAAQASNAVDQVFSSYDSVKKEDQVLVQQWVHSARIALGARSSSESTHHHASVSRGLGDGTIGITKGTTSVERFWLLDIDAPPQQWPSDVVQTFTLMAKLQRHFRCTSVELELTVDATGRLRLLQFSPTLRQRRAAVEPVKQIIARLETDFEVAQNASSHQLGARSVYGQMPDWNPAELIGEHPRALAGELFETLITQGAWHEARMRLGYRRSQRMSLLTWFAGRPYVDVRASLNSLIPDQLNDAAIRPVIEASLAMLIDAPHLHDRVETELQPTCLDFSGEAQLRLARAGLNSNARQEWGAALRALDRSMMRVVDVNEAKRTLLSSAANLTNAFNDARDDLAKLVSLLDRVRDTIATPFAMVARLAFVARVQLDSLVRAGAMSETLLTVVSELSSDTRGAQHPPLSDAFERRPSNFDILAIPYLASQRFSAPRAHQLGPSDIASISKCLRVHGILETPAAWHSRALSHIALREFAKDVFAHVLSRWLTAIETWGARREISSEELSHARLPALAHHRSLSELKSQIENDSTQYRQDALLHLPLLISRAQDFSAHVDPSLRPSFLGRGRVCGVIFNVDRFTSPQTLPSGVIVVAVAADPGFDWIFDSSIAALITCYGGPHSHMAIRCGHKLIPCVLGCGGATYTALTAHRSVVLDFDQKLLRCIA